MSRAKLNAMLEAGQELPDYMRKYPVYYAGPSKTPDGMPSGSFGPTTSGRMDSYVDTFQAKGGSMVMIGKGNRSSQVFIGDVARGGISRIVHTTRFFHRN